MKQQLNYLFTVPILIISGNVTRKNVKFKSDPGVLEAFSAQNSDYLGSGWSRGHMSPAGDNKNDKV